MPSFLVVDDELMPCDLLKMELDNLGHEVITPDNGREGIKGLSLNILVRAPGQALQSPGQA